MVLEWRDMMPTKSAVGQSCFVFALGIDMPKHPTSVTIEDYS